MGSHIPNLKNKISIAMPHKFELSVPFIVYPVYVYLFMKWHDTKQKNVEFLVIFNTLSLGSLAIKVYCEPFEVKVRGKITLKRNWEIYFHIYIIVSSCLFSSGMTIS